MLSFDDLFNQLIIISSFNKINHDEFHVINRPNASYSIIFLKTETIAIGLHLIEVIYCLFLSVRCHDYIQQIN